MMEAASSETPPLMVQIVDIRDDQAYAAGHIETAIHLHNANLQEFIQNAEYDFPLMVYCYHGHMSQSAAAYLAEQGFTQTYSLDVGYEALINNQLTKLYQLDKDSSSSALSRTLLIVITATI